MFFYSKQETSLVEIPMGFLYKLIILDTFTPIICYNLKPIDLLACVIWGAKHFKDCATFDFDLSDERSVEYD